MAKYNLIQSDASSMFCCFCCCLFFRSLTIALCYAYPYCCLKKWEYFEWEMDKMDDHLIIQYTNNTPYLSLDFLYQPYRNS